jgi:hypothetical protein
VGSTGGRNAPCEHLSWGLVHQGFSGSLVELPGDGAELGLAEGREIDAVGQVLAQQAVGVLVGAALPGALGVAEVSSPHRVVQVDG